MDISVSNVQLSHAAKSGELNNYREEEEHPLGRVSRQIFSPPFTQATVGVKCYGQGLVLLKSHPIIVGRKCFMAACGVMQLLLGVMFYIDMENLLAKAVSLPKYVIVALETNALPHIIDAQSDEPDTLQEPKLDNTTLTKGEWVEIINVSPISPQNRNAKNGVNTIQLAIGCQYQWYRQKQNMKKRTA